MTNQERIRRRIERDKARKAEKRRQRTEQHGSFERVITMQNLHRSLKRRRLDVAWKGSVQRYLHHAIVKLKRTKDDLMRGQLHINRTIRRRIIYERGKARMIHAIMIDARVIQGALCDSSITPLTQPTLIYDNPASTKGKGVSHARRRNMKFIAAEAKRHGREAYALTYDFTGYFSSMPHELCRRRLQEAGMDERLTALTMYFVKLYQEQDISLIEDAETRESMLEALWNDRLCGATLGSQISQDLALAVPNSLDHAVKDRERCKHYIRFMDDGIIYGSKDRLARLLDTIRKESAALGLKLNEKKTKITKMSRGITFLKVRYAITRTGAIIRKIVRDSIIRMRRKLKKFRRMVDQGEIPLNDVFTAFSSWYGNTKQVADTYHQRKRMLRLYNDLFHGYRLKGMKI
ncbi:MAG: hypothetical protein IKK75_08245 [Clostridia bacterium]|nr:hypothetical protein [Clostridia bacterium]